MIDAVSKVKANGEGTVAPQGRRLFDEIFAGDGCACGSLDQKVNGEPSVDVEDRACT